MRIDPQRDTVPAARPAATSGSSAGFANALASARNSVDPSLPAATDPSRAGEVPIAQRWGEYGRGASAEGYGAPPDVSEFADVPVGPNEPASPLNPSGVTTTPAFTIDGYTARGTPVPPGFYNLAYYNWYLREGGTPLEGFPQLADGATLSETYGEFGDGGTRATSFITQPADGGNGSDGAPPTATDGPPGGDGGALAPAFGNVADALAHAIATARTSGATPTASTEHAAAASTAPTARTERIVAASTAPSSSRTTSPTNAITSQSGGGSAAEAAPTSDVETALRAELTSLLRDLLRA